MIDELLYITIKIEPQYHNMINSKDFSDIVSIYQDLSGKEFINNNKLIELYLYNKDVEVDKKEVKYWKKRMNLNNEDKKLIDKIIKKYYSHPLKKIERFRKIF